MTTSSNEAAVHARLEQWLEASRAMNLDAIRACYVPDMVSYDCHSAFQFQGIDAYSKHLEMCFSHMAGPATIEVSELSVTADEHIAFGHMTMHCGCTSTSGTEHWCWLRSTVCLRKIDGHWLIAHDHCSAPFDPMSNQAMLDAGPQTVQQGRAA
ncbi:YybH family protein [Pseudorhodoplanes sinuspersici]|uniref:Uncharacterized protein n=1 Tax=Pseudorhodoplanes sinuspersici TaxID=1235591 RepID=A0A1W6ZQP8_9HYPH|nr:nuclear transport factor 2 family protein [Pseudorhodoplanes sinuspersici]ARP99723.1 hypothetical protein CAK95_11960 [Pseudorhodoplanes sinuspersici]RKE70710.1 uncharacterized protein (TIGR02246 family) [Pseudorhodoplanes sinuspersici]